MGKSFTIRGGKSVPTDAVFVAWTSGDLKQMLRALGQRTNLVDRHYLLLRVVEETYRLRSDPTMAAECARVSEIHLAEFQQIAPALKAEFEGLLPRVSTFQNYATLLTEQGNYERAIWVCDLASYYGLDDGTKAGFSGRVDRIHKKQAQGPA
jgi:hypothetical protein